MTILIFFRFIWLPGCATMVWLSWAPGQATSSGSKKTEPKFENALFHK